MVYIAWSRFYAIILKEFRQMFRDFSTVGMMLMIPLIQIIIFGYAINTNPKHLPTAIVQSDHSQYTREFIAGMQNTDYFAIKYNDVSESMANDLIREGKVQFVLTIPSDFTQLLIRQQRPSILLEADTSDPVATNGAIAALTNMSLSIFDRSLRGSAAGLMSSEGPFKLVVHSLYNPSSITQYNVVPGLMGVVLTLTLVMITAVAITRERELGTLENLLATPLKPLEVTVGKILPYIIIGYAQALIILAAGYWLFQIPMRGSVALLLVATLPFIISNLAVGITLSTVANNQLQANTSSVFFFLPSILLSGFLFPFYGMPLWAQYLGECLPLTHYLRIVRGIILKGNHFSEIWPNIWPLLIILVVTILIATVRYRRTLD